MSKEQTIEKIALNQLNKIEFLLDSVKLGNKIKEKDYYVPIGEAADLIKFYNLILHGQYRKAQNMAFEYFDTSARESIPSTVYNYLENLD